MNRAPLASTMMLSAGYNEAESVLEIEFRNGAVYQYVGVPRSEYDALLAIQSKGSFFQSRIRGVFAFRRAATQ